MKSSASNGRFINRTWDFFASVKLTVALLLSLASVSIIGTLVPQNQKMAMYVISYGESASRLFSFLGIFDMYHSWWFQLLILLMAINLTVCSTDRLSGTWKIVFSRKGFFNKERFRKHSSRIEFDDARSPEKLKADFAPIVSKGFGFFKAEQLETGFLLLAEKRRWARLGVYVVHLSVLILLAGALTGSILGFEGYANIPEGGETDVIRIMNSEKTRKLDFAVRCDDFDVSFYKTGAPKEFRSKLAVVENGKTSLSKEIVVNDPLRHKGINFFQSSYGRIPSNEIGISFTMAGSGMVYTKDVRMGEPVEIPEGMGTFTAIRFVNSHNFRGHNIGSAYIGVLKPKNGKKPVDVILPVSFPSFDRMRRDKIVIAVSHEHKLYYTGLQVTSDPGVPVVYIGFVMMIIGFYISFFMYHQQVFVEIKKAGRKSSVTVAGISGKNMLGMRSRTKKLSSMLMASQEKTNNNS